MLRSRNAYAFRYGVAEGRWEDHGSVVPFDPKLHVGGLRRLEPGWYRGRAFVHWTMALEERATGWLDELAHARIREELCHALSRYDLVCPAYCLMPDHAHFLWVGCLDGSDQRGAVKIFREGWNVDLRRGIRALQKQAHDHVLREPERERGAFAAVASYVFENPVRKVLAERWQQYPFLGAVVPGYPRFDPRDDDFWERFWRIYAKLSQ